MARTQRESVYEPSQCNVACTEKKFACRALDPRGTVTKMGIDELPFVHVTSPHRPQFHLGLRGIGWGAFDVVRSRAVESISQPYRIDVTAVRSIAMGPVDLGTLVGASATLAIAGDLRWKQMHGIVVDVQLVGHTPSYLSYELVIAPTIYHASLRRRCRTFVDWTLRDILTTVLENRSLAGDGPLGLTLMSGDPTPPSPVPLFAAYTEPQWMYRFVVGDRTRLEHAELRSYVVQYNETDLAFLSRLLEEEGLSYFFETVSDGVMMTITDSPGAMPLFPSDLISRTQAVSTGHGVEGEYVVSIGERASLSPNSVTVRDFAWPRSRTRLEAQVRSQEATSADSDHFEFPARDEAVTDRPCEAPANVILERFEVDRHTARGTGTVRVITPGYRWHVHDFGARDHDVLVVSVEAHGEQLRLPELNLPPMLFGAGDGATRYANRFEVLPMTIRFRPSRSTPRPRIQGVQSALVTAEEHGSSPPEINADADARVRVRFPWDQNPAGNRATSMWIRVSQGWAGAAFGAHYVPRVGHEVLVAYLQGDPERPVIVGRVYNRQTPPPYNASTQPAVSTLKSQSTPDASGSNELRFDDSAGAEELYVHAQRDLVERVEHDESASIGHDQSIRVEHDQSVDVSNEQSISVGANRTLTVGADRRATIDGNDRTTIQRGDRFVSVDQGNSLVTCPAGSLTLNTGMANIEMLRDRIKIETGLGASIRLEGDEIYISAKKIYLYTSEGAKVELDQQDLTLGGRQILGIADSVIDFNTDEMNITASAELDVKGAPIKLNCD